MTIHKDHLHDDEAYLQKRMQILTSGRDYWDLVEFYIAKRDYERARDALLGSFEFARQQCYAEYKRMKGFLMP